MADHSHAATSSAATSHDTTSTGSAHTHHVTLTHFDHSHHDTARHHAQHDETTPLKQSHSGHHHCHHHGHHHHHHDRSPSPPPAYGTLPSDPENPTTQRCCYDHSQLGHRRPCPGCADTSQQDHPCTIAFRGVFIALWLVVVIFIISSFINQSRQSDPWAFALIQTR